MTWHWYYLRIRHFYRFIQLLVSSIKASVPLLYPCDFMCGAGAQTVHYCTSAGWCCLAPYRKEGEHRPKPWFPSTERVCLCVFVRSEVAVHDHVKSVWAAGSSSSEAGGEEFITYVSSRSSTNASTAELRKAATTATDRGDADGDRGHVGVWREQQLYSLFSPPALRPHDWSITS